MRGGGAVPLTHQYAPSDCHPAHSTRHAGIRLDTARGHTGNLCRDAEQGTKFSSPLPSGLLRSRTEAALPACTAWDKAREAEPVLGKRWAWPAPRSPQCHQDPPLRAAWERAVERPPGQPCSPLGPSSLPACGLNPAVDGGAPAPQRPQLPPFRVRAAEKMPRRPR